MRRRAASAAAALVGAALLPGAAPAHATTPGANGFLAFVRHLGSCPDIEIRNPASGALTKLTNCPQFVGDPAWSPDGGRLAVSFTHGSPDSEPQLALLPGAGGSPTFLMTGVQPVGSPAFSRSGSVLVFAGGDAGGGDNVAIYTVPVEGGSATKLIGGGNGSVNDEPDWSPAADTIAWTRKTGPNYEIWTMSVDADGHNPAAVTQLTNSNGTSSSRHPSWSPDGTKLAFASNRSGSWQIYVMAADGTGVVQITTGSGTHTQPTWSPDGTQIAFASNGDVDVVDVTDLAHPGTPHAVVASSAAESDPQWAPKCTAKSCPATTVRRRTITLKPLHHLSAQGRLSVMNAPTACRAGVPVLLQYENVIDRGEKWHHSGHWVIEGRTRTTSRGGFHLTLPSRLTGWYRVIVSQTSVGQTACTAATSPLRVNNFIRDPAKDSRGPVDIAWGDAAIKNGVVTFTLHTYGAFSSSQRGVPCVLFLKRVPNSHYGGSVGCFGGVLLGTQHKPLQTSRPDSRTIVYTFSETELEPGFTNFEWAPWSRGTSDRDWYDVAPNDSEIGRGGSSPPSYPPDMPILFKTKPTYHR